MAAISYLINRPSHSGLIDIRHLSFIVLHDRRLAGGPNVIRCAGYAAASVPWGVKIGGENLCKIEKDLALAPTGDAKGRRLNVSNGELLSLALALDHSLERHSRYPHLPRRELPRWPKLWAGFSPEVAGRVAFSGPEFESNRQPCDPAGIPLSVRSCAELMLYPLEFVSHAWRQILAVFADLTTIPKRQVVSLEPHARNLRGYDGAIEFDLLSSRFLPAAIGRRRSPASKSAMAALAS